MTDPRAIHIVDDEEEVRASTAFLLEVEGFAVKTWPDGRRFIEALDQEEVGCVLLDIRMPYMDGLDVLKWIKDYRIEIPVIMLTGHADVAIAVRAMKLGSADFLEKPFERAALLGAVREAMMREESLVAHRERGMHAERLVSRLSAREREVLVGLAKGLPNKHIAYDLGISPRTVEIHRANLMAKLQSRSLSETLRIAFAAGIDADLL